MLQRGGLEMADTVVGRPYGAESPNWYGSIPDWVMAGPILDATDVALNSAQGGKFGGAEALALAGGALEATPYVGKGIWNVIKNLSKKARD